MTIRRNIGAGRIIFIEPEPGSEKLYLLFKLNKDFDGGVIAEGLTQQNLLVDLKLTIEQLELALTEMEAWEKQVK